MLFSQTFSSNIHEEKKNIEQEVRKVSKAFQRNTMSQDCAFHFEFEDI